MTNPRFNGINYHKFEIAAVIVSAIGKFVFYDILDQRFIFILLLFAFWSGYIVIRFKENPKILKLWGFRLDNFKEVLRKVLPFGLTAVTCCLIIGSLNGTINVHWHAAIILLVYPLFGVLQQFLLMSFVAGNMKAIGKMNDLSIILLTSALFGILHYPHYWLIFGTFLLSLFYTYIFLTNRNLYVLGIFHGWLGTIFYYTVVNKDPYIEVFSPLF